jgi:hypothetical protein
MGEELKDGRSFNFGGSKLQKIHLTMLRQNTIEKFADP